MGRGKPSNLAKVEQGIEIDPQGNIEEAEAAGCYKYVEALPGLRGTFKGPKLAWILKRMLNEPAQSTKWFKEKALDLGLDPKETTIGAVFMAALTQEAVDNPSSPAAKIVFERIDGMMKQQMQVAGLGMVKHQVVVEGLSDDLLAALVKDIQRKGEEE
jgi:hypothetical protein